MMRALAGSRFLVATTDHWRLTTVLRRRRRVRMQQIGAAQVGPQLRWQPGRQRRAVGAYLGWRARAQHDGGDRRVGQRELRGRDVERHAVARANRLDLAGPRQDLRRRGGVLVARPWTHAGRQDAAVEYPAQEYADLP